MFKGSFVALVTPFRRGKLDESGVKKLVEFHLQNKTSGIVPCATTGEAPTVTPEEWRKVLEIVVEKAKGKMVVVAYTGTNSTGKTVERTKEAERMGADAALVVTPYYNRPTQEGLYEHFRVVAESTSLPIMVYNVPSRTGVSIEPKTLARLIEFKNILAIKEASGNLDQTSQIKSLCGEKMTVLSGDDSLTLPLLALGARGVVSVVANIVPKDMANMIEAFEKGDLTKARRLHYRLFPLIKALFVETNPIPVKTAMDMLGLPGGELRLPLVPLKKENREILKKALRDYGLSPLIGN